MRIMTIVLAAAVSLACLPAVAQQKVGTLVDPVAVSLVPDGKGAGVLQVSGRIVVANPCFEPKVNFRGLPQKKPRIYTVEISAVNNAKTCPQVIDVKTFSFATKDAPAKLNWVRVATKNDLRDIRLK